MVAKRTMAGMCFAVALFIFAGVSAVRQDYMASIAGIFGMAYVLERYLGDLL